MFNNQVRQRVKGLVAGVGPSIISNPDLLETKLADLVADNADDIRLIVSAARAGIPEEIASAPPEQRAELAQQAATWMASETGASQEAAQWAVETWTAAVEGVKIAPPADAAAAPQPTVLTPPPITPSAPSYGAGPPPAPWDTPSATQPPNQPWGAPPPQQGGPWQNPGGYGAPAPATYPPPPGGPGMYPQPGFGQQPRYYTQPVNAGGILAMAIVAFFCFGFVLGPVAWVQANNALQAIDSGFADPSQRGTLVAARVCAIIATVLAIIQLIYTVVMWSTVMNAAMHHPAYPASYPSSP